MDVYQKAISLAANMAEVTASRDDNESTVIDIDECGAIEVSQTLPREAATPRRLADDAIQSSMEEPLSPHMDANIVEEKAMTCPLSPTNSILMDLSDLESSLNDEVDTVKGYLSKVKSERDTYKKQTASLKQELQTALRNRETEHSRFHEEKSSLQQEISRLRNEHSTSDQKANYLEERVNLLEKELDEVRIEAAKAMQEKSDSEQLVQESRQEIETLRQHLEERNSRQRELQEDFAEEKATMAVSQSQKIEEVRSQHFNQLSTAIADLEEKFNADLEGLKREKEEEVLREKNNHEETVKSLREELNSAKDTIASIRFEMDCTKDDLINTKEELSSKKETLDSTKLELAKVAEEYGQRAEQREEQVEIMRRELESAQESLEAERRKNADTNERLETTRMEMRGLKIQLTAKESEHEQLQRKTREKNNLYQAELDRGKEHLREMCELFEKASADRDKAQKEAAEMKSEVATLQAARNCFEKYDEEYKAEIQRLRKRLEESKDDILRYCNSQDSSTSSSVHETNEKKNDTSSQNIPASRCNGKHCQFQEQHESLLKERDSLVAEIKLLQEADESDKQDKNEELENKLSDVKTILRGTNQELGVAEAENPQEKIADVRLAESESMDQDESEFQGGKIFGCCSGNEVTSIKDERDHLESKVRKLEDSLYEKENQIQVLSSKLAMAKQDHCEALSTSEEELSGMMEILEAQSGIEGKLEAVKQERDELLSEIRELRLLFDDKNQESSHPDEYCINHNESAVKVRLEATMKERDGLALEVKSLKESLEMKDAEIAQLGTKLLERRDEEVHKKLESIKEETANEVTMLKESLRKKTEEMDALEQRLSATKMIETQVLTKESDLVGEVANFKTKLEEKAIEFDQIKISIAEEADLKEKMESALREREVLMVEVSKLKAKLYDKNDLIEDLQAKLTEAQNTSGRMLYEEDFSEMQKRIQLLQEAKDEANEARHLMARATRERDELSTELEIVKRHANSSNMKLREEIESMAEEHQLEIKSSKKALAEKKTQIKALAQELEAMNLSNDELEKSLEEMVELLEAERKAQGDQIKEMKQKYESLKHKYGKMRKKRVPVDAAFAATRQKLERFEMELERAKDDVFQADKESCQQLKGTIHALRHLMRKMTKELELRRTVPTDVGYIKKMEIDHTLRNDEKLSNALDEHIDAIQSVKGLLSSHLRDKEELEEALNVALTNGAKLQADVDDLNETKKLLNDEVRELKAKVNQEHSLEIVAMNDKLKSYESGLAEMEQTLSERQERVGALELQLHDLESSRRTCNKNEMELIQKDDEIKDLRDQIEKMSRKVSEWESMKETCDKYEADLIQKEDEINALQKSLITLEMKLENSSQELEGETELLQIEVNETREKLRSAVEEVDEQKETIHSLEEELSRCETRRRDLEEDLKAYQGANDELKLKLEAGKQELKSEVERLKTEFNEVIQAFEKELVQTCEANEETVRERDAEIEMLKMKFDDAEDEISMLEATIADLESKQVEMDNMKATLTKFESNEKGLAETIAQNEESLSVLRKELNKEKKAKEEAENTLSSLETSNEVLQEKLDGALMSVDESMKCYEELHVDHKDLRSKYVKLEEKYRRVEAEKSDLENSVTEVSREKENLISNKKSLEAEYERIAENISALEETVSKLMEENESLTVTRNELLENKVSLEDDNERLSNELVGMKGAISTLTKEKAILESQIDENEQEVSSKDQEILSMEEQLNKIISECKLKDEEIRSARADNRQASQRLDDLVSYTERLKKEQVEMEQTHRRELDQQMTSMNEVIQSLQSQVKSVESEKEENRKMYEKDIELQQKEVEALTTKHTEALASLDSVSDLVANLKTALDEEKHNNNILRSQFKKSEEERKENMKQNAKLRAELESLENARIVMQDRIRILEMELSELRPVMKAREDELQELKSRLSGLMKSDDMMKNRIKYLESQNSELGNLKAKLTDAQRTESVMKGRINALEFQLKNAQGEFKNLIVKKEEESSKLRVVLQEAREKLSRMQEEREKLKNSNEEALNNMKIMLNEAIRSRTETDSSLQENLQLLEQQKRVDIKRRGEISKLEQTIEILKSKERYLESYVSSLKNQINRSSKQ